MDICLENQFGVQNTYILRDAVRADPRIHQLLITIKYWTSQRCLNQSSHGTLSTFSWCVLVLYFVTHITQPSLLHPIEITTEGQQILSHCQQLKEKKLAIHCGTGTFFRLSCRKEGITGLGSQLPNTKTVIELLLEFIQFYASDYLFNSFDYYHEMISLVHPTRSSFYYYDNSKRKFFPFPEQARFTTIASELYSSNHSLIPSNSVVGAGPVSTIPTSSLEIGVSPSLLIPNLTNSMKEMQLDPPDLFAMMRNVSTPTPSIGTVPQANIRVASSSSSFIMLDGSAHSHRSAAHSNHHRAIDLTSDLSILPMSPNSNSTNSSQNGGMNPLWLLSGLLEGDDDDSHDKDSISDELRKVGEENTQVGKGQRAQTTITNASSDDNDALLDALIEEDKRNAQRRKPLEDDEDDSEVEEDIEEDDEDNISSDSEDESDTAATDECATTITSLTTTTMTSLTNSTALDLDRVISITKKEKKLQDLIVKRAKKEQARKKKLAKKFLRNLERQSIVKIQDPFEGFNLGRVVHNLDVQCILQSELRRYYYLLMTENSPHLWQILNEKHRFAVLNNGTSGSRGGQSGNKPSNIPTEDEFMYCASCRSIGHNLVSCFVACCAKCKQVGHKESACPAICCPFCKRYDHAASACKKRKPVTESLPVPPRNDASGNASLNQQSDAGSNPTSAKQQDRHRQQRPREKNVNDSNTAEKTNIHALPPNLPSHTTPAKTPAVSAPVTERKVDVLKKVLNVKSSSNSSSSKHDSTKSKPN